MIPATPDTARAALGAVERPQFGVDADLVRAARRLFELEDQARQLAGDWALDANGSPLAHTLGAQTADQLEKIIDALQSKNPTEQLAAQSEIDRLEDELREVRQRENEIESRLHQLRKSWTI